MVRVTTLCCLFITAFVTRCSHAVLRSTTSIRCTRRTLCASRSILHHSRVLLCCMCVGVTCCVVDFDLARGSCSVDLDIVSVLCSADLDPDDVESSVDGEQ